MHRELGTFGLLSFDKAGVFPTEDLVPHGHARAEAGRLRRTGAPSTPIELEALRHRC